MPITMKTIEDALSDLDRLRENLIEAHEKLGSVPETDELYRLHWRLGMSGCEEDNSRGALSLSGEIKHRSMVLQRSLVKLRRTA